MDWSPTYIKTDEDRLWLDEGLRFGYRLRIPAAPFWRLPVVRHLRAFWRMWQCHVWNRRWDQFGTTPATRVEEWLVYAIWKGWQ